MAKSRLAPRDRITIPRLELLAALIAVRLKEFLTQNLSIAFEAYRFYTDSAITFHWVTFANPGAWKTYVSNLVIEIRANSRPEEWFHVKGKRNIAADLATRGVSAEALEKSTEWWIGPEWLRLPLEQQPLSRPSASDDDVAGVRSELRAIVAPIVSQRPLLDLARHSSAGRAVRVLANVLRFCSLIRHSPLPDVKLLRQTAECHLIRWAQCEHFHTEIEAVRSKERIPGNSKLGAFNLFLDEDGLLRARTRAELRDPFHVTGVDFCGPFHIRQRQGTHKAYVAVFTCTTIRAVHLELVPSQSTPQTHLAIRRFLASHPACIRFISDNGASFVKAATELKRLFNTVRNPDVRKVLNGRSIDWSFITPRMPSHGGFYEGAVGILKSALIKTLGRSLIGYEEFRTVLCELAAIINERPLTYVPNDANEPTAITSAHFLRGGFFHRGYAGLLQTDKLRSDELATADDLRRGLALRTTYFKSVSVRWFREYLSLLRSANATRGKRSPPIRVDDVCILGEDNVARVRWPLVRVIEAHAGRDGLVRTYTVKFAAEPLSSCTL
ncbi:uncharacterized protein LOC100902829 [Galendromus occidentalis]|uniref:Uncharacterized protein LOC100902829 n=1 Tax=Galendromus occidentalis TaxID=34638 RepID=A0AAJ6QQX8_9ACAR|nr:uncharacterized protein LOC100902829 [Galendromus occidentalis]